MSDTPPPLPGEKQKFKLAVYNLAAVIGAIAFVLFLNRDLMNSSAEGAGRMAGLALGCVLFPVIAGWVCYRVGKRSNAVGNVVFLIVLIFVVLGQVGQTGVRRAAANRESAKLSGDLEALRSEKDQFTDGLTNISQLEGGELDKFRDERQKKFQQAMDRAAQEGGPEQREFYQKMKAFSLTLQAENKKWEGTWNVINEERFFDFTRLKKDGEMDWQLQTVDNYLNASTNYLTYMTNALVHMKESLKPLYPNSKLALGAVKGAKRKFDQQRPVLVPLFERHFSYGNKMREVLVLLQAKKDVWEADAEGIRFSSEPAREEFNRIIAEIVKDEEAINKLSTLMVKLM